LGMLWDLSKGGNIINLTKLLYDSFGNTADFDKPSPTSDNPMRTVGQARLERFGTNADAYIEDATFFKLREISITYDLPESFVKLLGPMTSAQIGISGRNLLTFTPYTGLDPEVSNFGNTPIGRNIDVAPYAPSRQYWFSLTATF